MRVLVVDDSAVARRAIAGKLRARGCEVVEADCAKEGARASSARVDAAVIDLELGDGDGVEVATALRAARAELPIAFFTSAPRSELAGRAGAIARVYVKPEQLDDVVAWALAEVTRPSS